MRCQISNIVLGILSFICIWSCESQHKDTIKPKKINGVSLVASRDAIDSSHIVPISNVNANYASVMPFGFVRNLESAEVLYNTDRQWRGERVDGVKETIKHLHNANIKVMLKPQIWISRGEFTGDMIMSSEENWKTLENSYEGFILLYAQLAQDTNTEWFCIGTELYNFVSARPKFWSQLIQKVKTIYSGKLTYAENWDKVDKVTFWAEMDAIGADAYFPISEEKTPTVKASRLAWQPWKATLKNLNKTYKRPILFTEYGYRSLDYSGKKPWESHRVDGNINLEAQNNLTTALFKEFWNEPWFAGGFIWKWFQNHADVGGIQNNRFTPQNKPVENILKEHYRQFSN
jgi:hypothetical protein